MSEDKKSRLNAEAGMLEDGRIISFDDNANFYELVDGEWVKPIKGFTAAEYWNARELSEDEVGRLAKTAEE